jgi:diguanylate cyclase (GGDEF)-like protein
MLNADKIAGAGTDSFNADQTPVLSHLLQPAEVTMQQQQDYEAHADVLTNESCLVQIYPADVIDGMMLLDEEVIRIGRDFECDLSLNDGNVSRKHAEITRQSNGHVLVDLGSTNGTSVNGARVQSHPLRSGDQIAIGPFIFKYLSAGSIETHYHEAVYTSLTRDALTGAMNKRYLLESLQREIARSRRDKQPLAVVMIDIDHFKSVNDTHGHLIGDAVLREFGTRLLSICREDDLLARYGGEEFSLLLSSTGKREAVQIAEKCRAEIESKPFDTDAGQIFVTASFGIECFAGMRAVSANQLIEIADNRLYEAKQNGRNCVIA